MEMPIPNASATYGKDTLFDLEAGMMVYGPAESRIGIVTEVAGFGSTSALFHCIGLTTG